MPADEIEIVEGEEEGIRLHDGRGPRMILDEDGYVTGLRTVKCLSVFDENGKFSPKYDEDVIEDIAADTIMFAIGQQSDLSFLEPLMGVGAENGLIKVDPTPIRRRHRTHSPAAMWLMGRDFSFMPSLRHRSLPGRCTIICAHPDRCRRQEALAAG